MRIQFELTFKDYIAAQRLHATRNTWSAINYVLNFNLSPVFGLCMIVFGLCIHWGKDTTGYAVIVFSAGLLLILCPLYLRMRLKSCYTRTRTGNADCTVNMDAERILIEAKNMKSEMDWSAVQFVREDEKLFMLYLAPAKFVAIPKRACSAGQIDEIETMLSQYVRPVVQP